MKKDEYKRPEFRGAANVSRQRSVCIRKETYTKVPFVHDKRLVKKTDLYMKKVICKKPV